MDDLSKADLFGSDDEDDGQLLEAKADPASMSVDGNSGIQTDGDASEKVVSADDAMQPSSLEDLEDHDDDVDQPQHGSHEDHVQNILKLEAPLVDLPPHNSLHLIRTTNIIGIEKQPFNPATFKTEEGQSVGVKMRWRVRLDEQGNEAYESNARFVKWSDGSLQLVIGDEPLDVMKQDISQNNNYLFQLAGGTLQGQAHLSSRLALRPASLNSKLHKEIRNAVAKGNQGRGNKVVAQGGLVNPEADKAKKEAAEEAQIRSRQQLAKKQDQAMRKGGMYGGRPFQGSRPVRLSASFLEDEDEDDWDTPGGKMGEEAEEEERLERREEEEEEAARRLQGAKRPLPGNEGEPAGGRKRTRRGGAVKEELVELPEVAEGEEEDMLPDDEDEFLDSEDDGDRDEGEDPEEGGEDKDEEEAMVAKRTAMKARRGVVLSDDDD